MDQARAVRPFTRRAATQLPQQPEGMPPHVLAMLARAAERRRFVWLDEGEVQRAIRPKWRYVVDPWISDDRVDDAMLGRVEAVCSKWRPRQQTDPGTTPIIFDSGRLEIQYDFKLRAFKLLSAEGSTLETLSPMLLPYVLSCVISSPLLLYRLRCLFPVEVQEVDRYKSVWEAEVVHKASGRILGFGEHKGAPRVYLSPDEPNREFVEDGIELLNLLCDPRCPHPYDGIVAGSVA